MQRLLALGLFGALSAVTAVTLSCAPTGPSFVTRSVLRGEFIDASFLDSSGERRFLFPPTVDCWAVLQPEAKVTYSAGGLWGQVRSPDGAVCEPVGIADLHRWRRTRPEGEMTPSGPARWTVVHRDDEVFLLRGRFPLAGLVGMAGGQDLVAMVANDETCRPVAESGNATLVYRPTGRNAFLLSRCPVLAFARP